MWHLVFILTVYGTHGCVMISPDQKCGVGIPALTSRKSPGVNHLQTHPPWWLALASVSGLVLLIGTVFLGRKACRLTQRENNSKQNKEEVKTSADTEDNGIISQVGNSSMPDLVDVNSPPSSADSIYVTMHGLPFPPDAPVTAGRNRRLPSDWHPKDEESVYVRCQDLSWASALKLSCVALMTFLACPVNAMDVLVPLQINALNGTDVRIPCAFTSCYKLDPSKFAMNWTYQETSNSTEEMFMTYKNKITPLKSSRFGDRVVFSGNLEKNDLTITISDVQLTDEGIYNCYVRNPPDRILGHGTIQFVVLTELPPPRDSTIAVAIGASVGGILALLILSMVVVKCIRRHKNQELISDEQKMEEEGKADGEGGTEEATKQP
ncbi:hypothetical protein QQF64_008324 [Cirrhinus molitorella]|uniref:Ig-like domain-containing protein n=2 Tax=Cirrhinus molitorella TaxID=172907 RepID=A0ABR3M5U1_9TELE